MNWDRIAGNWKQLQGSARQRWGRLTDDGLEAAAGNRQSLAGDIQKARGIGHEARKRQLAEWTADRDKIDPIHR
jgi:uncharacterized protein YjbJ (UPF0337 family)